LSEVTATANLSPTTMNAAPLLNSVVAALAEARLGAALAALRQESERALVELIRRRLALPVEKRMDFLRVRLPGGGSYS
jgi:hypothetical protein